MNLEQLNRAKEIEHKIADLSKLKKDAEICLEFYNKCEERELKARFHYRNGGSYTMGLELTRQELISGLTIVIDRYKREIQKLEQEFKNL